MDEKSAPVNIKIIILDVDGTLTDGCVYYGDNSIEIKAFDIKDGLILANLPRLGINIIFLTGRESEAVRRRAAELGATAVQGISDKQTVLHDLLSEHCISPEKVAYIGDDLNDYAAMKTCGFKACPSDAAAEIKAICDYISPFTGGNGAVRDICEHMLRKTGKYNEFSAQYGIY